MKPKALVIALLTAGAALPNLAHAAEPATLPSAADIAKQWAGMFVYAVTPYCQVMSNGLRVCQPMGLVGPAPTPGKPPSQPLKLVPLAPPTVQSSPASATPYMSSPYAASPFMPGQYAPQPGFVPPAMMAQPMPPQYMAPPFMPQQFLPPQFMLPTPMAPQAAQAQPAPAKLPASPAPKAATLTPVAAAPAITPATPTPATAAPASQPATAVQPAPAAPTVVQAAPAADSPTIEGTVVHFAFDSAELDASGRLVLDGWLMQAPKDRTMRITGHADRLGPDPYNAILSRRRAEIVKQYLAGKGMKADGLKTIAMGEKVPVIQCKGGATPETKACLAPNRRVEIRSE